MGSTVGSPWSDIQLVAFVQNLCQIPLGPRFEFIRWSLLFFSLFLRCMGIEEMMIFLARYQLLNLLVMRTHVFLVLI